MIFVFHVYLSWFNACLSYICLNRFLNVKLVVAVREGSCQALVSRCGVCMQQQQQLRRRYQIIYAALIEFVCEADKLQECIQQIIELQLPQDECNTGSSYKHVTALLEYLIVTSGCWWLQLWALYKLDCSNLWPSVQNEYLLLTYFAFYNHSVPLALVGTAASTWSQQGCFRHGTFLGGIYVP